MVIIRFFLLIFIISSCFAYNAYGQARNDYNWIMGYTPNLPEEYFGGTKIDFNLNSVIPSYFETICNANEPAILSSNSGELLAYSEGCRIYNREHKVMTGGDTIAYGRIWDSYCDEIGYPGIQNHILLPWPGDTNKAALIYLWVNDNIDSSYLLFATLEFSELFPLGRVTLKDQKLLSTTRTGFISAVKHANGRDWWVVLPEPNSNRFFTMLLEPSGIILKEIQSVGKNPKPKSLSGQSIFTPDGKNYVVFDPSKGIDIYDFDRCNGLLSNVIESGLLTNPPIYVGGVAASADSRFLYVSNNTELFQYDLTEDEVFQSKTLVGTYDGHADPFQTNFYHMKLAPDENIYMFSTSSTTTLNVINRPQEKGVMCNLTQHQFDLPTFTYIGAPLSPYFRLGPDDNSSCDTLGIDNRPVAFFNYTTSTTEIFDVQVKNLSYFNPETFYWTFGDGGFSIDENPISYSYTEEGVYEICLTATNEYDSHTFCRNVTISDSTTNINTLNFGQFKVFPNPFSSKLTVINNRSDSPCQFLLHSAIGELALKNNILFGNNQFSLSKLSNGFYFYSIINDGQLLESGKLIKIDSEY